MSSNSDHQIETTTSTFLDTLTDQIDFYFSAIVIPIGIILNLITIIIFATSGQFKSTNLNVLYIGLGIYDILALLNSILFAQLLPSLNIRLANTSLTACIVLNWYRKVAIQAPSWAQVLLTFERYLSVARPNRLNQLFKIRKNAIAILVGLLIALTTINMGHGWLYMTYKTSHDQHLSDRLEGLLLNEDETDDLESSFSSNATTTTYSLTCTYPDEISIVTGIINVLLRFLMPFAAMLTLNIFLSKSLYESKRRASNHISKLRSFKRERNYTITVVGFNILFFLLNLPWAVWFVMNQFKSFDKAALNLLNAIVFCIFYLNNLSSFLLNFSFNKLFRAHVFFLMRSVSSSSSSSQTH